MLAIDTEVIRDQLLNILLAARDTVSHCPTLDLIQRYAHPSSGSQTTALLSHTIYLFAMHPDVLKKAREEILDVVGSEGAPTVEKMRGLKYRESPHPSYTNLILVRKRFLI